MTNKVVLRSTSEFMSDYTPIYQPIYPLFLGKSQAYSEEVGSMDFKRVETVGDIRAKHITPKDTVMQQIAVNEAKKTFKKYFLANQFVQSALQDRQGLEDIISQVLDEHQKQADDLLITGDEGTNNGLFTSSDSNYTLEASAAVAAGTDGHLLDMHNKIMSSANKANAVAGRKVLIVYGATAIQKYNSLHSSTVTPFKKVLSESLGGQFSTVEMPSAVTPASSNGWILANLDQCKLHYTTMPALKNQGVNDEKMYAWFNFLMGSMMLECLAPSAIIRQPVTFA